MNTNIDILQNIFVDRDNSISDASVRTPLEVILLLSANSDKIEDTVDKIEDTVDRIEDTADKIGDDIDDDTSEDSSRCNSLVENYLVEC